MTRSRPVDSQSLIVPVACVLSGRRLMAASRTVNAQLHHLTEPAGKHGKQVYMGKSTVDLLCGCTSMCFDLKLLLYKGGCIFTLRKLSSYKRSRRITHLT